ncbi:MAG: alpha/beta hydrolase [Oscillospiraceae bacterium]|jgi:pimeloyl-ACP methyl ester carboxylesterase|nr:alpha/beta hydrolase [Oscillospiraceae bacterium]
MFVETNGVKLYCEQTGQGPALLLLHGNGEDHTVFDESVIRFFSGRYRVVAVDSRDHGRSDRVGVLRYEDMAEDMAGLIAALSLGQTAVLGFSDGGIVGLLLAARRPELVSKLVAAGANTRPGGLQPWFCLAMWLRYLISWDKKIRLMLTQPHISQAALGAIRAPTLVLAGGRDIVRAAHTRALAAAIPGSELCILPDETHDSYVRRPAALLRSTMAFLDVVGGDAREDKSDVPRTNHKQTEKGEDR